MKEKIKYTSEGLIVVGEVYEPENFDSNTQYPAILVGGSWTTVKELFLLIIGKPTYFIQLILAL
jgi:hypothetical protein